MQQAGLLIMCGVHNNFLLTHVSRVQQLLLSRKISVMVPKKRRAPTLDNDIVGR
jgi:hypothetical protein